jgi:hypothetical protein
MYDNDKRSFFPHLICVGLSHVLAKLPLNCGHCADPDSQLSISALTDKAIPNKEMFWKEILATTLCVLLLKFLWKWKRFLYLASKIPKSQFDFSWKGILDAINADNKIVFKMIYESLENVNGLAKTWLGPVLFVIISLPEDVRIVMNSRDCLDKPYFIKYPGDIFEGSLFGSLKYWHSHRKILDPYFGQRKLKNFLALFDEKSKVLTENIAEKLGKGEFDVFHYMTALTLEIILNAMELKVDIQNLDSKLRDVTIHGLEK